MIYRCTVCYTIPPLIIRCGSLSTFRIFASILQVFIIPTIVLCLWAAVVVCVQRFLRVSLLSIYAAARPYVALSRCRLHNAQHYGRVMACVKIWSAERIIWTYDICCNYPRFYYYYWQMVVFCDFLIYHFIMLSAYWEWWRTRRQLGLQFYLDFFNTLEAEGHFETGSYKQV